MYSVVILHVYITKKRNMCNALVVVASE